MKVAFIVWKLSGYLTANKRGDYRLEIWEWVTKEHWVWVYKRIVCEFKMGGGGNVSGRREGVRNFPWLQIFSIVRKRQKGNPEWVNGDYSEADKFYRRNNTEFEILKVFENVH